MMSSRTKATLSSSLLFVVMMAFMTIGKVVGQQQASKNREMKSEAIVPLRSHSIYAPYVDSNLQNKFWDFGGNAIVDTNRHIRLTQDRPHQMGWLWSRLPIAAESYEVNVEFNLDGTSTSVHGDGFAMWLTTERNQPGPVFGSKNYFTGMGLFFDTFANARHSYTFPRASLMLGNGVEAYDVSKDGEKTEIAGCSVDIRRPKVASKAKLTYVKGVYLELELHYKEWDTWESCFKLENIALPKEPYLGFSAFTGDVSDNHDLVSVSTNHIVYKNRNSHQLKEHRDEIFRPQVEGAKGGKKKSWDSKNYFGGIGGGSSGSRAEKSGGGFFSNLFGFIWFVIKWVLILATLAGLILVGLTYQRKRDAKRF